MLLPKKPDDKPKVAIEAEATVMCLSSSYRPCRQAHRAPCNQTYCLTVQLAVRSGDDRHQTATQRTAHSTNRAFSACRPPKGMKEVFTAVSEEYAVNREKLLKLEI